MPEYRDPGVFVDEVSFRRKSIEGVSTSVAGFAGPTRAGSTGRASDVLTSLFDFEREYGDGADLAYGDGTHTPNFMWHAARAFFANGGQRLHVTRVWRQDDGPPAAADYDAALERLEHLADIAVVAAPGSTYGYEQGRQDDGRARIELLLAHAERMRRFALIDAGDGQSASGVRALRASFKSGYAALYYPWVRVHDPVHGGDLLLPPSGFLAGIYARVDLERGVHAAPANEIVTLATGLERDLPPAERRALNDAGINCLRGVRGRGFVVWGARTLSSDSEWKYVNVRRLLLFLEASIERGTQWAVFEPNAEPLWIHIRQAVENFLVTQWRAGALQGATPDQAFFVKCDRTTMTQDDLDNGRLICLIGVAPVRPAEFVIFRIGQWTADRTP